MAASVDCDNEQAIIFSRDYLTPHINQIKKHDHTLKSLNTALTRLSDYIYNPPVEASTDVAKTFRPLLPKMSNLDSALKIWSAYMQHINSLHIQLLNKEPIGALSVLSAINDAYAHLMTTLLPQNRSLHGAVLSLSQTAGKKIGLKAGKVKKLKNELVYLQWDDEVDAFHSAWQMCWIGLGGSIHDPGVV